VSDRPIRDPGRAGRSAGRVYGGGRPDAHDEGHVYGRATVPHDPQRPPRRRGVRWGRLFLVLGVLVLVLVVGATATGAYFFNKYDNNVARVGDVFGKLPDRPAKPASGAMNILLVGADKAKGGASRSDTIMLMHLPSDRKRAYLISIPRDSWVPIPGNGRAKINAAFSFGGPSLLVQTVEGFTDVHIDHFMQIDFAGFQQMTDAVGGVDVPGAGHLDGKEALKYVRERKSLPRGDFDRIKRQQGFLRALLAQSTASFNNPFALARLLDAVSHAVSVDSGLSSGDLRSLVFSMRNLRDGKSIQFLTAPNTGTGVVGSQSVVFLDKSKGVELWGLVRDDRMGDWQG
jgi:anionic cell wall polymer biosynthesis LytR-Cps2A-Psr (LCP) family protein